MFRSYPYLTFVPLPRSNERSEAVGDYIVSKYRRRAKQAGYYKAALQLKKQGIPLEIARLILL